LLFSFGALYIFFNTITKDYIYTDLYTGTKVAFRKHILDNPANKVIDLPAPVIPNEGGKETFTFHELKVSISTVCCFSSTVGLVLVDNWVQLAIFCLGFV